MASDLCARSALLTWFMLTLCVRVVPAYVSQPDAMREEIGRIFPEAVRFGLRRKRPLVHVATFARPTNLSFSHPREEFVGILGGLIEPDPHVSAERLGTDELEQAEARDEGAVSEGAAHEGSSVEVDVLSDEGGVRCGGQR